MIFDLQLYLASRPSLSPWHLRWTSSRTSGRPRNSDQLSWVGSRLDFNSISVRDQGQFHIWSGGLIGQVEPRFLAAPSQYIEGIGLTEKLNSLLKTVYLGGSLPGLLPMGDGEGAFLAPSHMSLYRVWL